MSVLLGEVNNISKLLLEWRNLASFSYVFEIYSEPYNPDVNHGLIVDEKSILTAQCAAWGDWNPPIVPRCIRK